MSRQNEFDSLTDPKVLDILDLCLSCKACKSECPSNVDMAKLKSEVLQLSYEQRGIPLSVHILRWNSVLSKWIAGPLAPVINAFNTSTIGRWIIEQIVAIDRRRILPLYSSQSLAQWFIQKHRGHTLKANKKVALFADTYINYHDVHIGQKVIDFLSKCGYMVELLDVGCCQRPAISNGLLRYGKQNGQAFFKNLKQIPIDKPPFLLIDPS